MVPQGRRPRRCKGAEQSRNMYREWQGGLPQSDALAAGGTARPQTKDMQRHSTISSYTIRARVGCLRVMPWRWSGSARPQTKELHRRSPISGAHVRHRQGRASELMTEALRWFPQSTRTRPRAGGGCDRTSHLQAQRQLHGAAAAASQSTGPSASSSSSPFSPPSVHRHSRRAALPTKMKRRRRTGSGRRGGVRRRLGTVRREAGGRARV